MDKQGQFQRQQWFLFPLCESFSYLMFSRIFHIAQLKE